MKCFKVLILICLSAISFGLLGQTCPLKILMVRDTVACRSEFPPPKGTSTPVMFSVKLEVIAGNAVSIVWSNGNTGPVLKPDSAGSYEAIVTDISGCKVSAKVSVKEYNYNAITSVAGFQFVGTCLGDTTKFYGTSTELIDIFSWSFGNGTSSGIGTGAGFPKVKYNLPGPYIVGMRLTNRCGLDTTVIKQINIYPPPPKPTLPISVSLCNNSIILDANSNSLTQVASYLWSTGATSKTVIVSEPSVITVTNTDINGCSSKSSTIVTDNRPQVNLGPSKSICQFSPALPLSASNPGMLFSWQVNGLSNGNQASVQSIDSSTTGLFVYSVKVTDPVTTCFRSSSTNIVILSTPKKPTLPSSASICQQPLILDANSTNEPGLLYSWSTGETSRTIQVTSSTVISVMNLNQQTGCSSSAQVTVTDSRPSKPTISLIGQFKLRSSSPLGNQWFKDGSQMTKEVNQDLTLTESGSYSVQTTLNGCSSIKSDSYVYTITGFEDLNHCIDIYPNPTEGYVSISLKNLKIEEFKLTDLAGREIPIVLHSAGLIDITNVPTGVYLLSLKNGETFTAKKIIKR